MKFSAVFKIAVFIAMSLVVNGMTGPNFEIENITQMGKDAVSMAFSNEMMEIGEVNGTKEANVTTMDHGLEMDETKGVKQVDVNVATTEHGLKTVEMKGMKQVNVATTVHGLEKSTISPREPIYFPNWVVIDCVPSDNVYIDQWTCDLRRQTRIVPFGFIDTLNLSIKMDGSAYISNMDERCHNCNPVKTRTGQSPYLRLVVECPKVEKDTGCLEGMTCVRADVFVGLLTFFVSFMSIFVAFLCGVCIRKCAERMKRSNRIGKSTNMQSNDPASTKW